MNVQVEGLWRRRAFVLLWTGQTVSLLGSQVTLVALPLTAILVLNASAPQVGLLMATGFAAAALFGLVAGVWVDRVRRRNLLIGCQLLQATITLSVPIAGWLGFLRLEHLFVLEALGGALGAVSNAAGQAYIPSLVPSEQLVEANARLAVSRSVTRIIGPSLAGTLVQLVGGASAILLDALSFAISAACLIGIRSREERLRTVTRRSVWAEMQEGLYLVFRHRLIRPIVLSLALYNAFAAAFTAVYTLFMVHDLGLEPVLVGVVLAGGGVGGVIGGVVAAGAAIRFGIGRAIVGGAILLSIAHLAAPLAAGGPAVTVPLLFGAGAVANLGLVISTVNQTSLIQQLVPAHALGRVAATQQVVITATVPFGAIVGGLLGEAAGLRPTVGLAAIGTIVAMLALLTSPLVNLFDLPEDADSQSRVLEDDAERLPPPASGARVWPTQPLPHAILPGNAQ